MDLCTCGLVSQVKSGTYEEDGREYCKKCLKPLEREGVVARAPQSRPVSQAMVASTDHLPGYRVEQLLGVVTSVGSNSGFSAKAKGGNALSDSLASLCEQAGGLGANAIIGLGMSAFGAGGGITNALGGDAVGIAIWGTAVRVSAEGLLR